MVPKPKVKVPDWVRAEVFARAGHRCESCGRKPGDRYEDGEIVGPLHFDHIVPEAMGGETTVENGSCKCSRCNFGKGVNEFDKPSVEDDPAYLEGLEKKASEMTERAAATIRHQEARKVLDAANLQAVFAELQMSRFPPEQMSAITEFNRTTLSQFRRGLGIDFVLEIAGRCRNRFPEFPTAKDCWTYFCAACWGEISAKYPNGMPHDLETE